MDGYFPLSGGEDTCSGTPDVARFGQFLAWRCERGAEVVFGGEQASRGENITSEQKLVRRLFARNVERNNIC